MAVSFPQNPSEGDTFTSGNTSFVFTNGKWVSATSPDSLVSKSGDTMTGALNVPAGASGNQVPRVNEVVKKSGDTMTGTLLTDNVQVATGWLAVIPVGGTATGLSEGTAPTNGLFVTSVDNPNNTGSISTQNESMSTNIALSKKGSVPVTGARFIKFSHSGNLSGSITVQSTSSILYNSTSDYRLKENVTSISGAADQLMQLNPCRYNYIGTPEMPMMGFLAHEVQTILPEIVTGDKDAVDEEGAPDYQQIDYSKLTPLLTAALQEALTRIEALEEIIDK